MIASLPWSLVILSVAISAAAPLLGSSAQGASGEAQPIAPDHRRRVTVPSAEARDLLMAGYYERAIETYAALAADPGHAIDAGIGLAQCRMQIGAFTEALAGLIELDQPESASWHYVLAKLYRSTGDYEAVLRHARQAVAIDANHAGARLLLASTLELLGRRDEAIDVYRWFETQVLNRPQLPSDAEWITDTAQGFLRYSVLTETNVAWRTQHVLNKMLQIAYGRLDPRYWPARIVAAELLREKFNNDEDDGSVSDYKAALRINSNLCEAHVGLGAVALQRWDFDEVERRVERALAVNPNHAAALHLLANKFMLERRYDQALEACERALIVNPNDIVALSIGAGVSACRYDDAGVDAFRARTLKLNPTCALWYRTLGNALSGIRQYAASERAYQKAIELDWTDANARTELGMMYMQWGAEGKAREALEGAWSLDPFNERTKYTLESLEQLEGFTLRETDHFIVKFDAKRDPGLGELVADYLEGVCDSITDAYGTRLADKTIIEFFPTQRDFAVRITGKPWIHTVGACTGRVIAMASPRKSLDLMGPYNLARVLTHEFTHTVTLAATHNRIPHWFTEGLSVQQERSPLSFAWCELLADAARRDRLFTLESIDWGFARPRRPGDRQLAYAQSEMMCEYIVERFGGEVIGIMLDRFRDGQTQREVFVEHLGVDPEQFDRDFVPWARERIARWGFDLTPPENVLLLRGLAMIEADDAGVLGRLAQAQYDDADNKQALNAAKRALELDENNRDALRIAAKVLAARVTKDPDQSARRAIQDEMIPGLERLMRIDPDGWTGPKLLAKVLLDREEFDRAIEPLERLQRLCPMDPASWRGLAGIYQKRGQHELALSQLLELARREEHDAGVPARIASIYKLVGRLADAEHWYGQALLIDPFDVQLHQGLGDTHMRAGHTRAALRAYTALTKIEPGNARHFEQAAFAAHKLGASDQAQELARRAVELDSNSTARSLLPD